MNIWVVLWVFLTVFIVGIFLWSLQILLRQKRAWIGFAARHKLGVAQTAFFASPRVKGEVKGFPFSLYSEQQVTNANGSTRFRTIIQFELSKDFPAQGIIASAEAREFAKALNVKEEYTPDYAEWNKEITVFTMDGEALKPYFTPERCRSLNAVMTIKGFACILIFDGSVSYLRFETPDPLDHLDKLEKLVMKLADHVKILNPTS